MKFVKSAAIVAAMVFSAGLVSIAGSGAAFAQAANPCAGKPAVDSKLILRPKGTTLAGGDHAQLVKEGEALFKDTTLSTNGMACESCHTNLGGYNQSFAKPYSHPVAMVKEKAGVDTVQLDEMVQFCMVVPMEAKTLPWDDRKLAALTAYSAELQQRFIKQPPAPAAKAGNPCAPKANPCAPRN